MAYSEELADQIREALSAREGLSERKMFGGIAFMVSRNMACGVIGEELIVRLDQAEAERALAEPGVRAFDFTGRVSKGMVYVGAKALAKPGALAEWAELGADHAASLPR